MNPFLDNTYFSPDVSRRTIRRQLIGFALITVAITGGLASLYFLTDWGDNPAVFTSLFYVAVFAPTIASIIMAAIEGGWAGVVRLFAMLVRRTNYVRGIAIVLLLLPGSWLLWGLIERGATGGTFVDLHALLVTMPIVLLTTAFVFTDPGAIGEELGLRGYALPRLLALYPPNKASFILGLAHAIWHLPVFFIAGTTQSDVNLAAYIAWTIALSYIWTWTFLWANGNVLLSGFLVHLLFNVQGAAQVFPHLEDIGIVTCFVALLVAVLLPFPTYRQRVDPAPRAVLDAADQTQPGSRFRYFAKRQHIA